MASRNRPRINHNQDGDEEHQLNNRIIETSRKIDAMTARSASIGNEIVEIEKQQAALIDADKPTDPALDDKLEALYRENVRICEQSEHLIRGKSDGMNLLDCIRVLQGLREASEESAAANVRNTASSKQRASSLMKRKGGEDGEEGSAAPSPRVGAGRLQAGPSTKEKTRGSSAQPSTREVSVKVEDGAESVASSVETSDTRQRLTLNLGAMVFYRNKGRAQEGEGILCRVTSVIGEGKQRRYEIQDADPDPQPETNEVPPPYRASVSHLVPIPSNNVGLPDLPKGKNVLAQYPDTTTFYKAEVSTAWRIKDMGGEKGNLVRLRFEGEMEETKETEVERRFVLVEK